MVAPEISVSSRAASQLLSELQRHSIPAFLYHPATTDLARGQTRGDGWRLSHAIPLLGVTKTNHPLNAVIQPGQAWTAPGYPEHGSSVSNSQRYPVRDGGRNECALETRCARSTRRGHSFVIVSVNRKLLCAKYRRGGSEPTIRCGIQGLSCFRRRDYLARLWCSAEATPPSNGAFARPLHCGTANDESEAGRSNT